MFQSVVSGGQNTSKVRPRFDDEEDKPITTTSTSSTISPAPTEATSLMSSSSSTTSKRPSYMPTRGLAAVLNQGLASLGEKLGITIIDIILP